MPWYFGLGSDPEYEDSYLSGKNMNASCDFLILPLVVDPSGLFGVSGMADDMLNSSLEGMLGGSTTISGFDIDLKGRQKTGLVGMNFPVLGNIFTWGVSCRELFSLNINGIYTGADMLLGVNSETIDMSVRMRPTIRLDTAMQINQANLHFVGDIIGGFPIGVVLRFYSGYSRFKWDVDVDAIGGALGRLEEFNTDEHNSLAQSLDGELRNTSWGAKVGTGFCFGGDDSKILIHGSIDKSEPLKFTGTLHSVTHGFPESINITDITATEETVTDISDPMTINLPAVMEFKVVSISKVGILSLGHREYLSEMGFSYHGGSQPMELHNSSDFSFIMSGVRLGAGVINVLKPERRRLYYFSLGMVVTSNENWQWDQLIVGLPLQVLKTTISYRFAGTSISKRPKRRKRTKYEKRSKRKKKKKRKREYDDWGYDDWRYDDWGYDDREYDEREYAYSGYDDWEYDESERKESRREERERKEKRRKEREREERKREKRRREARKQQEKEQEEREQETRKQEERAQEERKQIEKEQEERAQEERKQQEKEQEKKAQEERKQQEKEQEEREREARKQEERAQEEREREAREQEERAQEERKQQEKEQEKSAQKERKQIEKEQKVREREAKKQEKRAQKERKQQEKEQEKEAQKERKQIEKEQKAREREARKREKREQKEREQIEKEQEEL
jgi:hypothetical protein